MFWTGTEDDGSMTVMARFKFQPGDMVGLQATLTAEGTTDPTTGEQGIIVASREQAVLMMLTMILGPTLKHSIDPDYLELRVGNSVSMALRGSFGDG